MTRFGELINTEKPVLINFYTDRNDSDTAVSTLRYVVAAIGSKAKVIKIDVANNENLADALLIKGGSTFMIYKNGEMKWRQAGLQDSKTLVGLVLKYL
ncbi:MULTISPECIES: thioredoxin family protein [unclassified Polaribacter]|uniref:thioredoxin family protein n=1 Tax=unclassified Polaribacter TaxID=196858 RepID=UPI00140943AD|nr:MULTISPECIES: thioredoxin family protein [unclassified Polaribacter]